MPRSHYPSVAAARPVIAESRLAQAVTAATVVAHGQRLGSRLVEVTAEVKRTGLCCRVKMTASLVERVEPGDVLGALHRALIGTQGDPAMALISGIALGGPLPSAPAPASSDTDSLRGFLWRARAGLAGVTRNGSLAAQLEPSPLSKQLAPLYVICGDTRCAIDAKEDSSFVIGRSQQICHLVIRDGRISRRHAAVFVSADQHHTRDIDSTNGVYHKGVKISRKQIEEGDVFELAGYQLRFTFRPDV